MFSCTWLVRHILIFVDSSRSWKQYICFLTWCVMVHFLFIFLVQVDKYCIKDSIITSMSCLKENWAFFIYYVWPWFNLTYATVYINYLTIIFIKKFIDLFTSCFRYRQLFYNQSLIENDFLFSFHPLIEAWILCQMFNYFKIPENPNNLRLNLRGIP